MNVKRWLRRAGCLALVSVLLTAACTTVAGESWAGIATDGHYVYVAYKEQIFRVDLTKPNAPPSEVGTWIAQAPNKPHFYAPPAISDSAVYDGAYDGNFYAFDRTKGTPLSGWTNPTTTSDNKLIGAPTLVGNVLYIGMGNQGVRAYDAHTGAELAHYDGTKFGVWSAPLVVGDTVYVTSLDHNLYALDAGTLIYKWQLDLGGAISEAPIYADGTLYVGTFNSELLAIDVSTNPGKIARRFTADGWIWGSPLVDNGTVYFGSMNGTIYALDAKTFSVKWTAADTANPGGIRGRLALVTDANTQDETKRLILAGSESKRLYAYNADTGKLVWMSALVMNDKILSDLVVVKPDVIFSTLDENQLVVALNYSTGQIDWQVNLSQTVSRLEGTPQS